MSPTLLLDTSNLKVVICDLKVSPHLFQCLGRDGVNSEFSLALSEPEPQFTPGRMARSLAKELGHFLATIAACQGCLVSIVLGGHFLFFFLPRSRTNSLVIVAAVILIETRYLNNFLRRLKLIPYSWSVRWAEW